MNKRFDLNSSFAEFVKKLNRKENNIGYDRRCDMKVAFIAGATMASLFLKEYLENGYTEEEILEKLNSLNKELLLTPTEL